MPDHLPIRIQRKRVKGWKMPPNTVYVGRPSYWGNPFLVGKHGDAAECVRLYRDFITDEYSTERPFTRGQLATANKAWPTFVEMPNPETIKAFLHGKNLACWCPLDKPCHADVLLDLAND